MVEAKYWWGPVCGRLAGSAPSVRGNLHHRLLKHEGLYVYLRGASIAQSILLLLLVVVFHQCAMSEPRKRNVGAGEVQSKTPLPATSATASKSEKSPGGFGVVDVLRILGGLVLLNCALSYFVTGESISWGWRPWYSKPASVKAWLVSSEK